MFCPAGPDGSSVGDPTSAESWLRVVTYRVALPEDERATNYMMGSIQDCLDVLEKQPGFQRGYWGRDDATEGPPTPRGRAPRGTRGHAPPSRGGPRWEPAARGVDHCVDAVNTTCWLPLRKVTFPSP